jgi:hypothetical protein
MLTSINKTQLAFLLDIKAEEARAKMCVAWCRHKGIESRAEVNEKNKVIDPYPEEMQIAILEKELNLPTLQSSIDDIQKNYLIRPGTKKWILCDYPEKMILKANEAGKKFNFQIPKALRSLLPDAIQKEIKGEWFRRYSN